MKKIFSLLLLMVAATVGFQSQAAMWLVGDAFNGWQESGNVEMTQTGDIYSYTAEVGANTYFAFFKDTQGWSYQRGPARGNDSAPLGDWEDTQAGGAWKFAAAGTYTIEYNYSTDQARIVANSTVEPDPFDADALTFVATGEAVGGWNMPPTVVFTKNVDGTHSLEINATAAEFKIAGVKDYSSLGWGDFDAGVYGGATLALGDNELTAGQTANMAMPQAGKLLLTISDVTESSCKLNIAVVEEAVLTAVRLTGSYDQEWTEQVNIDFNQNAQGGGWNLSGQRLEAGFWFKVVGTETAGEQATDKWYGAAESDGDYWINASTLGTAISLAEGDAGKNFYVEKGGEYTFDYDPAAGTLTVIGTIDEDPVEEVISNVILLGSPNEWAEAIGEFTQSDTGWVLADVEVPAG